MRRSAQIALVTALLLLPGAAQAAGSTIIVSLKNEAITTDLPTDLGMAMGGDKSKAMMSIVALPASVPAGEVTFVATNRSSDYVHEMIVAKVADPAKPLPYVTADTKVDEEAAGHLGEVSELDPGKSGKLTLTLEPGTYVLYCNIPGHYMAGMWATITVR
jgi:uncharacterized cupredoxin-like copper-binding protein